MKKTIYLFALLLLLGACAEQITEDQNKTSKATSKTDQRLESLKLDFGKSISNSLAKSPKLRELIKTESLKKFNRDYDVLYAMIKSTKIENGQSVEELVKANYADGAGYAELLQLLPTLTIMVPTLPEDSFSAELWDTGVTPAIAIKDDYSNDAKIIFTDGRVETLEGKYTPGFPVLVIKKNEVMLEEGHPSYPALKTDEIVTSEGHKFKFADNYYNANRTDNVRLAGPGEIDQKLIDARTIYDIQNPSVNGWHRDYIYYNITPTNPVGPFRYDFQECITTFRMSNPNAMISYNVLTNSNVGSEADPYIKQGLNITSHWTAGSYKFLVKTKFNNKAGIGDEDQKWFSLSPDQLFDLTYKVEKKIFYWNKWYTLESIKSKTVNLNQLIFNWDLNQYSSTISIKIEEVDNLATQEQLITESVKYATNFSFDVNFGTTVKTGLKFGASAEVTESKQNRITWSEGNDEMGSVIINFADKVIIGQSGSSYITREYDNTVYAIGLEPKRVQ